MSPVSFGVTRCFPASSWSPRGILSSPLARYGVNTPRSRARDSSVLSTPKKTSPCGLSLVRMALFTACPASPSSRTLTWYPDSFSNAARTLLETALDPEDQTDGGESTGSGSGGFIEWER